MSAQASILGILIDCTGRFAGCENAPAALRAAGLVERRQLSDSGDRSSGPMTRLAICDTVCRQPTVDRRRTAAFLRIRHSQANRVVKIDKREGNYSYRNTDEYFGRLHKIC